MQIATFFVPLVTLPYLSRVLKPTAFGLVLFAQGFSIFLTLFIDWGFTPYGVRKVAADRDDPSALARTVAQVRSAQLLTAALSIPIAVVCLVVMPKFWAHPAFLVMAWVAAASTGLMPNWYFVGAERVRLTAIVQLAFRVIGAVLTLTLVDGPRQAWIVMALYMMSSVGMWLVSDLLVYRRVPFGLVNLRTAVEAFADSTRLFVGTVSISLFSTFNVVLLGLFVPSAQVAQFGASERIVRTTEQILGPIGTAVYPRLTFLQSSGRVQRARQLAMIAIALVGGGAAMIAIVFAVFAPQLIHLIFGPRFVREGTPILRILVLLIPSSVVGYFGAIWLMTLHRDRTILRIAVIAGLLNVVLGSTLSMAIGPVGMAWSVVVAQFFAAGATIIVVYRLRGSGVSLFERREREPEDQPGWGLGSKATAEARAQASVD